MIQARTCDELLYWQAHDWRTHGHTQATTIPEGQNWPRVINDRKQYVTCNNSAQSKRQTIKCGVPKGSILDPLLFFIYINDLSTVSEACLLILFADDTNIFITSKNIDLMCQQLNDDLEKIQEWLCCNKLSLNVVKTHYMIFSPRNKIISDVDIKICNVNINRVYVTKFLGVQIDAQLNWKKHIEYINKKLSKCTAILLKTRKVLNNNCLINLYYTFAYPCFIYCNNIWGNTYPTVISKTLLVQKRLIQLVTGSPYRAHTEPLCLTLIFIWLGCLCINVYGSPLLIFSNFTSRPIEMFMDVTPGMLMPYKYLMLDLTSGNVIWKFMVQWYGTHYHYSYVTLPVLFYSNNGFVST